jgi:hypothetical protein
MAGRSQIAKLAVGPPSLVLSLALLDRVFTFGRRERRPL